MITLTGANFTAGDSQVTVNFGATPVSLVPDSDSQISVIVPDGAKSGGVTVTTTASYNGQSLVQTSNAEDILVIWKTFDLTPIINSYGNDFMYLSGLFSGPADNIYADIVISNWWYGGMTQMVQINADGTWAPVAGTSSEAPVFAIDPVTKTWAYEYYYTNQYDIFYIPGAGQTSIEVSRWGGDWFPDDIEYDGSGNVYVLAYLWKAGSATSSIAIWRFPRGADVALDPNAPTCLTPGGVPGFWETPMSVAPDGTVNVLLIRASDEYSDPEILHIPKEGGPVSFIPMPPEARCGDNQAWFLAADCMGRCFALNANSAWGAPPPYDILSVDDGSTVAQLGSDFVPNAWDGFTMDGYGDIYVVGLHGTSIHRILPSDLPAGFYDNFICCPTNLAHPSIVQKFNGKNLQLSCSVGSLEVKLTPDPSKPNVSTTITPDKKGEATANVVFGQAPSLEAEWVPAPGQQGKAETVTWTVKDETAPNAGPGLFPDRPELFLGWAGKQQVSDTAPFQTVHTGHFVVTLTTVNSHKGAQRSMTLTVDIKEPKGLSDGPGPKDPYDPDILYYADVYGIPPQYIKSQVYKESNHKYDANAFRYELESRDREHVSCWGASDWAVHDYCMYRFPRTSSGSILTSADIAPRNLYNKISLYTMGAGWPYTCAKFSTSDMDVTLWDYFTADNGWQSYMAPYQLYYPPHKTPCDPRQNWIPDLGWHGGQYYWASGASAQQVGPPPPEYFWFLKHPDYAAQTAICSSYGLMQVLYTTAVHTMGWRQNQPGSNRHPSDLLNPEVSLDLGVGYDALQISRSFPSYVPDLPTFEKALEEGFAQYNGSGPKARAYGQDVVHQASKFGPQ